MTWQTITVPVPDGGYAVPDPDDSAVTTFWLIDNGQMRTYPKGTRWAPLLPRFDAPTREERMELRQQWYRDRYWIWKRAVAAAIVADPPAAARRFHATYPVATLDRPLTSARRALAAKEQERRLFEAVWAASMARRGVSVAAVARQHGCAWQTARTRIAIGELTLTTEPERARGIVTDGLRALLEPDGAEHLAAALLNGSRLDAALIAARLVGADAKPRQPAGDLWAQALADVLDRVAGDGAR